MLPPASARGEEALRVTAITAQTSEDLLALYDRAPLNRRYWTNFVLLAAVYVLDFFDFF
jgi:hypothetical protein